MKTKTKYDKQKYLDNREEVIKKSTEWNNTHIDNLRINQKRYFRKNKEKINEYNAEIKRNEYNNNNNKRIKAIFMAKHIQFIKNKLSSLSDIIGMSFDEYKKYIESLLTEDLSWDNYGTKWRIERKLGLKELDLTNKKDYNKFCSYKNIKIRKINLND